MNSLILFRIVTAGIGRLLGRQGTALRPRREPLPVRMHRRWYVTSAPNRHRV